MPTCWPIGLMVLEIPSGIPSTGVCPKRALSGPRTAPRARLLLAGFADTLAALKRAGSIPTWTERSTRLLRRGLTICSPPTDIPLRLWTLPPSDVATRPRVARRGRAMRAWFPTRAGVSAGAGDAVRRGSSAPDVPESADARSRRRQRLVPRARARDVRHGAGRTRGCGRRLRVPRRALERKGRSRRALTSRPRAGSPSRKSWPATRRPPRGSGPARGARSPTDSMTLTFEATGFVAAGVTVTARTTICRHADDGDRTDLQQREIARQRRALRHRRRRAAPADHRTGAGGGAAAAPCTLSDLLHYRLDRRETIAGRPALVVAFRRATTMRRSSAGAPGSTDDLRDRARVGGPDRTRGTDPASEQRDDYARRGRAMAALAVDVHQTYEGASIRTPIHRAWCSAPRDQRVRLRGPAHRSLCLARR